MEWGIGQTIQQPLINRHFFRANQPNQRHHCSIPFGKAKNLILEIEQIPQIRVGMAGLFNMQIILPYTLQSLLGFGVAHCWLLTVVFYHFTFLFFYGQYGLEAAVPSPRNKNDNDILTFEICIWLSVLSVFYSISLLSFNIKSLCLQHSKQGLLNVLYLAKTNTYYTKHLHYSLVIT